jgi:non-heme chloroperoxidase
MPRRLTSVELPNGLRLPYADQGDEGGMPLVLIHAIGDSWRSFELLLDHMPESIRVFAPSQRGHGDAGRPQRGYRSRDSADDLAAFLTVVGVGSAVIAGASSGGLVAQRFALDHPSRTLGLVLIGSPLKLGDKPAARELWDSAISRLTDPVDPDFVRRFVEGMLVRPVPQEFLDSMVQENLKVPAFVWKATWEGLLEDDFSRELGGITAPALVIWGERDSILARSEQEVLATSVPRARLLIYPATGHMLYWEDPGRVAADIVTFVTQLAP